MRSITRQLLYLALLILLTITNIACTTTTKKLTTTKSRVDTSTQFAKAREAFNQKNYKQAAELLQPMAEQGNADAQYALGYLYHNGLGVPRNYKLAIQWITAASAKGNEKATEALRLITEQGPIDSGDLIQKQGNQQFSDIKPEEPESAEPIVITGKKDQTMKENESNASVPVATSEIAVNPTRTENAAAEETALTEATEPKNMSPEKKPVYSDSEKWIMEQEDTNFTIQIMASSNEKHMERFVEENNLGNSTVVYKTRRNGKDWFTLVQGSFESPSDARNAIENLPPNLQQLKPWVKPFSDIKDTLKNR